MQNSEIQYITDTEGNKTALIIDLLNRNLNQQIKQPLPDIQLELISLLVQNIPNETLFDIKKIILQYLFANAEKNTVNIADKQSAANKKASVLSYFGKLNTSETADELIADIHRSRYFVEKDITL